MLTNFSKELQSALRCYYLEEALAFYEIYYAPLVEIHKPAAEKLKSNPNRLEDRPPTWVPLVWHCTTHENFSKIVKEGFVNLNNGCVCLTELPIGELDRMKYRCKEKEVEQLAIAFPRRFIEKLSYTPVLYLKHANKKFKKLFKRIKEEHLELNPIIELSDNTAAFYEIRTLEKLDINQAVWLLSTKLDSEKYPVVPLIDEYQERYGPISQSYWHRSHQLGIIGEFSYFKENNDKSFSIQGEYYFENEFLTKTENTVNLPAGGDKKILFRTIKKHDYEGPMTHFDMTERLKTFIKKHYGDNVKIEYSLIQF